MQTRLSRLALLGFGVVALAASGCIQMDQKWKINADGSGTVAMNVSMSIPGMPGMPAGADAKDNPQVKEMMKENDAFKEYEGLVVKPDSVKQDFKDGKMVMSGIAYFEDITKVSQKGKPVMEWSKAADGGFSAKFNKQTEGTPLAGKGGKKGGKDEKLVEGEGEKDDSEGGQDEQMQAMMKSMMKGFKIKISVQMPGAISKTAVTKFDDRTFGVEADDKIMESKEAQQKFQDMEVSASCGKPGADSDKDIAAFKAEFAKVKEEAAKADAVKKAEGDKKGKPGSPGKAAGKDDKKGGMGGDEGDDDDDEGESK